MNTLQKVQYLYFKVKERLKKSRRKKPEMIKYHIFCIGTDAIDSIAGTIITPEPLQEGQLHLIKNRKWVCKKVAKNYLGEPVANFTPYYPYMEDKPGQRLICPH